MIRTLGSAAVVAALAAAGAAQAQDFQPKAKGDLILNVRITDVASTGSDPIVTLAGAPTAPARRSATTSCRRWASATS